MKKIYFLILIINTLSFTGFAQDRIIKITKDTINCQIKEIGDNPFHYAFLGGSNGSSFSITSGLRIGVLF